MSNQDNETIKRVLEAVLRRLEREPDLSANSVVFAERSDPSAPVIVILSGLNSSAPGDAQREQAVEETGLPGVTRPLMTAHNVKPASHPGLERFPLAESGKHTAAPKTCFMEPGRSCVSSGACEMRGY